MDPNKKEDRHYAKPLINDIIKPLTDKKLTLKERAEANEKNCQTGANYFMYDLAMYNVLSEPFRSYAVGFPVPPEDVERWNKLIINIASSILGDYDEIIKEGAII